MADKIGVLNLNLNRINIRYIFLANFDDNFHIPDIVIPAGIN